jgi:hypothetical protein
MHRFVTDLLVTTTASAVMLAAVLLAGTALVQPVPPPAAWTDDDAGTCHDVPVAALAASAVEGRGRLCLDHGVVRLVLQVGGLTPGDAYTAWLAYFDRPDGCAQTPCGLVDLRGDDPAGVLGRVGGGVPNHTRMLELRAELRDLLIAPGAQVSLLLLNHGPASIVDARARARQVLTAEMPDLDGPGLGAAGDGRKAFPHALAVFTVR